MTLETANTTAAPEAASTTAAPADTSTTNTSTPGSILEASGVDINSQAPADATAAPVSWEDGFKDQPWFEESKGIISKFVVDGKFDPMRLAKSYANLERYKGVAPELPESYDLAAMHAELREEGFEYLQSMDFESEAGKAELAHYNEKFKAMGLTTAQAKETLALGYEYGVNLIHQAAQTMPQLKSALEETEVVRAKWGDKFNENIVATANYVKSKWMDKYPGFAKAIFQHSDAVFAIHDMLKEAGGANPLPDAGHQAGLTLRDVQAKIDSLNGAQDYWTNPDKQKEVAELSAIKYKMMQNGR